MVLKVLQYLALASLIESNLSRYLLPVRKMIATFVHISVFCHRSTFCSVIPLNAFNNVSLPISSQLPSWSGTLYFYFSSIFKENVTSLNSLNWKSMLYWKYILIFFRFFGIVSFACLANKKYKIYPYFSSCPASCHHSLIVNSIRVYMTNSKREEGFCSFPFCFT